MKNVDTKDLRSGLKCLWWRSGWRWCLLLSILSLNLVSSGVVCAKVRLPAVFGEHMMFQSDRPIVVWGWARAGEKISVSLGQERRDGVADAKGNWRMRFSALDAGVRVTMTVKGDNAIVLRDILIGEVWLCSGQSNMSWPLVQSANFGSAQTRKALKNKMIRVFGVRPWTSRRPRKDLQGSWRRVHRTDISRFSAICFYFGQHLQRKLGVPVGLIHSSVGGTMAEAWMPYHALTSKKMFSAILKRQEVRDRRFKGSGPHNLRRRRRAWHFNSPSGLYNAMISPLTSFGIRGVIWYQGESNLSRAYQYRSLFPALIRSWRLAWGVQLPFLFVQLAPFRYRWLSPSIYNELCEAQTFVSKRVKRVAMVTINDLGTPRDIHPRQKLEVGRRLALAAMPTVYLQSQVYSGPIFERLTRLGRKLLLSFRHVGGGLVARGGVLRHFTIAGADRKFVKARAVIRGERILVWSEKVAKPVAVRFAWRDDIIHNLANRAGFPASSFRTDRWGWITRHNR